MNFTGNLPSEALNTTKCASSTEQTAKKSKVKLMEFEYTLSANDFSYLRGKYDRIYISTKITRIKKALVNANVLGFTQPVFVNKNSFSVPVPIQQIVQKRNITPMKISLNFDNFLNTVFFTSQIRINKTNKGKHYALRINSKERDLLKLKHKSIVKLQINEKGPIYVKCYIQNKKLNKKSLISFLPTKLLQELEILPNKTYQFQVTKSNKKVVSNEHFVETDKTELTFSDFYKGDYFDLESFLSQSHSFTSSGKPRKFIIENKNLNQILVSYKTLSTKTTKVKLNKNFSVTNDFYRVIGLIQAEASKTTKKCFCFTNKEPSNVKFIIDWFAKYAGYDPLNWIYELTVGPKVKNIEKFVEYWVNNLEIERDKLKVYSKSSNYNSKEPIFNLRANNRTLSQIIMRLLETTLNYVTNDKFTAGHFLGGVFAGDGYAIKTKSNTLNYVGLCFDPNKMSEDNKNEFSIYIDCLNKINIPFEDISVYLSNNEKTTAFIEKCDKSLNIRVRNSSLIGFGGEILIFKYRSFKKLEKFNVFHPNIKNSEKFLTLLNKIDTNKIRYS